MTNTIILDTHGNEIPAKKQCVDQLILALDKQYPEDAPHIVIES